MDVSFGCQSQNSVNLIENIQIRITKNDRLISVPWWQLTNANYNNQLPCTAKDADYIVYKDEGNNITSLHLQNRCIKYVEK